METFASVRVLLKSGREVLSEPSESREEAETLKRLLEDDLGEAVAVLMVRVGDEWVRPSEVAEVQVVTFADA